MFVELLRYMERKSIQAFSTYFYPILIDTEQAKYELFSYCLWASPWVAKSAAVLNRPIEWKHSKRQIISTLDVVKW